MTDPITLIDEAVAQLSHWAAHLPLLPEGFRYEFDLKMVPPPSFTSDECVVKMIATPTALAREFE